MKVQYNHFWNTLFTCLFVINCTHASIPDGCEESQIYIKIIKVHCDYSEKTLLGRIIILHKKYVKIHCDHGEKTLLKVEVT